jgi:hypothetical protein
MVVNPSWSMEALTKLKVKVSDVHAVEEKIALQKTRTECNAVRQ